METFYIRRSNGEIYALDATVSMQYQRSGKLTTFPIQSRAMVSDHYINNNDQFQMRGKISTTKSNARESNITPERYIEALTSVKEQGELVTVFWAKSLEPVTNCVITNFSTRQDRRNSVVTPDPEFNPGVVAVNTFGVSITLKKIRTGTAAVIEERDFPPTVVDDLSNQTTSGRASRQLNFFSPENEIGREGLRRLQTAGQLSGITGQ